MTPKIEPNDLRDILKAYGLDLFQDRRNDPKARAQDCLEGLTHYVDAGTLRYFGARVLESGVTCSGTLFYIIESTALDYAKTRRGFRGVVFDLWGTVIYRVDLDNAYTTKQKAHDAMYAWLDQFDVADHYMIELERRARRLDKQASDLRECLAAIYAKTQSMEVPQ